LCGSNFFWRANLFIERAKLHEIADTVTRLLSAQGFTCLDAEWEAHSRTLRLFIDHAEGIDLDQCAKVSGILVESPELDVILDFEFNLEVSSPGVERPVRTMSDFESARSENCQIDVKLTEKYKNRRKGVGKIAEITPDHMISMTTAEGLWTFPWSMVLKATKVVDWNKFQD
jgi:ribosome maturation factor RimP